MTEKRLHIFKDEHVYNLALLTLFATEFQVHNHQFIFLCKPSGKTEGFFPGQVSHYPGYSGVMKAIRQALKSDLVYFHSLPMGPQLILWTVYSKIFKKAVWIFWGADIYAYRNRYKNLKQLIYHLCRKRIINKLPHIAGFLKGDYDIIRKIYRTKGQYQQVVYPIPAWFDLIKTDYQAKSQQNKHEIIVLLGNSASKTNQHLDALETLGQFNQENMRIICPLSYGYKRDTYVQKVMDRGHEIFGKRFHPLTGFLEPAAYNDMLANTDIAVMNHNRQEALGNIIALLYMGKKVFLRPETSSFIYFKSINVRISNIDDLKQMTFEEFSAIDENSLNANASILKLVLGIENYRKWWNSLLKIQ